MVAATMPAKGQTRLESRSRLAYVRHGAAITQTEMARRMGVSIATYQRLEEGRIANPPLGYLVSAALILDVPVAQLVEPQWLAWWELGRARADPASSHPRDARWGSTRREQG